MFLMHVFFLFYLEITFSFKLKKTVTKIIIVIVLIFFRRQHG